MAKQTLVDVAIAELVAVGLEYRVDQGKHYKVRFWALGRQYTYVVARSASDHRAAQNVRTGIRRILRELGLLAGN